MEIKEKPISVENAKRELGLTSSKFKPKENICECGHDEDKHDMLLEKWCTSFTCPCKKFKLKKEVKNDKKR